MQQLVTLCDVYMSYCFVSNHSLQMVTVSLNFIYNHSVMYCGIAYTLVSVLMEDNCCIVAIWMKTNNLHITRSTQRNTRCQKPILKSIEEAKFRTVSPPKPLNQFGYRIPFQINDDAHLYAPKSVAHDIYEHNELSKCNDKRPGRITANSDDTISQLGYLRTAEPLTERLVQL